MQGSHALERQAGARSGLIMYSGPENEITYKLSVSKSSATSMCPFAFVVDIAVSTTSPVEVISTLSAPTSILATSK